MTKERTITKGNPYDSRTGGKSYAMWTSGYDVCIEEADGMKYFYQLRNYDHDEVKIIGQVELSSPEEMTWEKLNENVRKAHFKELYPNGTKIEMLIFVYGDKKGRELFERDQWAENHRVYDRKITLRLEEELGRFEEVQSLGTVSRCPGTGYKDYRYVLDGKWLVTVSANMYDNLTGSFYASYKVEDYTVILAQQKVFGRRVARLAKSAGVPWNVAVFVGHIASDEEAIEILKLIKRVRGTADDSLQWELSCGIGRRTDAIKAILGKDTWAKIDCKGQRKTTDLANYLLGE